MPSISARAESGSRLPGLKEIGEVRQEIAGSVHERERKEIFRSGPDYTESNSAYRQDNDRVGNRVERARI